MLISIDFAAFFRLAYLPGGLLASDTLPLTEHLRLRALWHTWSPRYDQRCNKTPLHAGRSFCKTAHTGSLARSSRDAQGQQILTDSCQTLRK